MDPDNVFALISRGNALHALKRFDEALASCDRAITVRPDYVEAHYNRGNALHQMRRFEEAVASYTVQLRCGLTTPKRTPTAAIPCTR